MNFNTRIAHKQEKRPKTGNYGMISRFNCSMVSIVEFIEINMRRASRIWTMCSLPLLSSGAFAEPAKHPIAIEDVLAMEHIEVARSSPDGEMVAVVVRRAAGSGEVYGRTAFETDPGRTDIWLFSNRSGERRQLTDGKAFAAGYWCATWSPDGRRLAMLSTQPEGSEPRGGDNVRLYIWDRTTGRLTRQGNAAVMTQTHYGSSMTVPDFRGGAERGSLPHACSEEENAPFLWLDSERLLVATLPEGQFSGLIDQYGRARRAANRDTTLLREGVVPTGVAFGSGAATAQSDRSNEAVLRIIDVTSNDERDVARVPAFPFLGAMSVAVSPDGRRLAILATTAALQPADGRRRPFAIDDFWSVQRRLGFVDLANQNGLEWSVLPAEAKYPLELYHWSPDGKKIVLRARSDAFSDHTKLYLVPASGKGISQLGNHQIAVDGVRSRPTDESPVLWIDTDKLLIRTRDSKHGSVWRLIGPQVDKRIFHEIGTTPEAIRRTNEGDFVAVEGGKLLKLDLAQGAFVPITKLARNSVIVWPRDPAIQTSELLIANPTEDAGNLSVVDAGSGKQRYYIHSSLTDILDVSFASQSIVGVDRPRNGITLKNIDFASGKEKNLLALNNHFKSIDWGAERLINYKSESGHILTASVIFPPGYNPNKRYPTLFWVYQGYQVKSLSDDYFLDPYLPGIYNLRLYASHGYVVVVPSMPLPASPARNEPFALVTASILPAIDYIVKLGIADPRRLGVFGQSRGGYTVAALLAQTDRFKAGVALAGIYDLSSDYRGFDDAAYGWPGIGHQKNINWAISEQFGRFTPPSSDPAGYARNSPLTFANSIVAPLLIVHGEADNRGNQNQAEQLFGSLYEQGKTAQYVRYGGESHSLAQSPANVRDIVARTLDWFDTYLR